MGQPAKLYEKRLRADYAWSWWRRRSRKRKSACAEDPTRPSARAVPSRKSSMVQGFFNSEDPWPALLLTWHQQRVQKPRHRFVDPAVQSVAALACCSTHHGLENTKSAAVMLKGRLMHHRPYRRWRCDEVDVTHEFGAKPLVTQRQRPSWRKEQRASSFLPVEEISSAQASE